GVFGRMRALAATPGTRAPAWRPAAGARAAPPTLAAAGLGLSAAALVALLLGLAFASRRGAGAPAIAMLALACTAGVAYVRHARRSSAPLLDLALLSQPLLRVGVVIYLCVPGIFTGVNLIASLFLQNALGLGATQVGALMVPWAAASFAAIATTRRAFPAVGARPLLACGVVVDCIGIALLATPLAAHEAGRVLAYVAMGFGASLCTSTSQTAAFLDVPADRMGEASALWNINRQLSFCLGVAVLGGMLNFLLAAGGGDAPLAYRRCFAFGALLTLLPLPLVARLGSRRAAVSPAVSVDAQSNRT
ncbi:MFS transporter, partial [Burkholderia pseudomallei]|uniref:MFS transporter n=1 Tax=Burkholderia pseudomallei TaxID=28450 RepID=UPI0029329322